MSWTLFYNNFKKPSSKQEYNQKVKRFWMVDGQSSVVNHTHSCWIAIEQLLLQLTEQFGHLRHRLVFGNHAVRACKVFQVEQVEQKTRPEIQNPEIQLSKQTKCNQIKHNINPFSRRCNEREKRKPKAELWMVCVRWRGSTRAHLSESTKSKSWFSSASRSNAPRNARSITSSTKSATTSRELRPANEAMRMRMRLTKGQ